jgi:SAM-dependent methyltransferase
MTLEWTGERFLPWRNDPTLAYEHLHRYLYASRFVAGKSVLDLASGEGYGSNLLAQSAAEVIGVDLAVEVVAHARQRYPRPNLEFLVGSITNVPISETRRFDVVVCFEAIEHIEDHRGLLAEIVRLLEEDGVLIVSTPNKNAYHQTIQQENEFHVKELEFDEFRGLLQSRFQNVCFLGQRIYAQSDLWPVVSGANDRIEEFIIERTGSEFAVVGSERRQPMYFIAVASNAPLDDLNFSALIDSGNALLLEKDRELRESKAAAAEGLAWRERQIAERDATLGWFETEVAKLKEELAAQRRWYESEVAQRDATIASNDEALAWRAGQVQTLEREKSGLIETVQSLSGQLSRASEQLDAIHASSGWKFILRLRHYRDRLLPPGSTRRRFFDSLPHKRP